MNWSTFAQLYIKVGSVISVHMIVFIGNINISSRNYFGEDTFFSMVSRKFVKTLANFFAHECTITTGILLAHQVIIANDGGECRSEEILEDTLVFMVITQLVELLAFYANTYPLHYLLSVNLRTMGTLCPKHDLLLLNQNHKFQKVSAPPIFFMTRNGD